MSVKTPSRTIEWLVRVPVERMPSEGRKPGKAPRKYAMPGRVLPGVYSRDAMDPQSKKTTMYVPPDIADEIADGDLIGVCDSEVQNARQLTGGNPTPVTALWLNSRDEPIVHNPDLPDQLKVSRHLFGQRMYPGDTYVPLHVEIAQLDAQLARTAHSRDRL